MANDELRSVRIEVEAAEAPDAHVPDVVGQPSSRGGIGIVAALAVVVLGVVLFMLRPAGDQAADGTVREVPTTTTAATTTTSSEPESAPSTVASPALIPGTRLIDEPVTSVRVDSPRQIEQIVSLGDGFVALPDVESTVVPQMLASLDGLNWFEIETQRFGEDADSAAPSDWFSLLVENEGLAVIGSGVTESGSLDVLTSSFGQTWRAVSDLGPVENLDRRVVPVAIADERIVALELFEALELEAPLGQVAEVRVPLVCSDLAAGPFEFSLSNCPQFGIDADSFIPEPPVARVPDCATLTPENGTPGFALLQLERTEGSPAVELPTVPFVSGDFFPNLTDLGSGRVGVFDVGNAAFERCDGSGVVDFRAPGVVIVDVEQNLSVSYPAPDELADDIQSLFDNQILGEVQVFDDRMHLVVSIRGALWAIDAETGRWSELTDSLGGVGSLVTFNPEAAASTGGDRFYRVGDGAVRIFELVEDGNDTIRAAVTMVPIAAGAADAVTAGFGSILHATNELIFYTDGITVWRLEIPAAARG